MSRVFCYCRVSTSDQTTDNQLLEIKKAGFDVKDSRVVTEVISGGTPSSERKGFKKLLERMEEGDVLVVTKLDRLGRNSIDVQQTVKHLEQAGIKVHCLALGGVDLTSAAGKMTMGVLAAVAEFERDLLIERTQSGLQRAKADGKTLGRPKKNADKVQELKARGLSQSQVVEALAATNDQMSLATVKRLWNV